MHRVLKQATARPPASNMLQQQDKFESFMQEYNYERPHEGIQMKTPASLYEPSTRIYKGLPELQYPFLDRTVVITVCAYLLGSSKNQRQYCARRSESRNQTGRRPNLASQLYGIRSGLLRHGQLPYRTWTQSIWAQVVNDVIGTNCK